jgi:hypothetical protein
MKPFSFTLRIAVLARTSVNRRESETVNCLRPRFFGRVGSLIYGRVVILSPRLRGLVLNKSSVAETTTMYPTGDEAQNSSSHT